MKNFIRLGGLAAMAVAIAACGDDTGGAGGGGDGGSGSTSTSTSTSNTTTSSTTTGSTTGATTTSTGSGEGGSGGEGGGTTSGGGEGGGGDGGAGGTGGTDPGSVVEVDCAGAAIAEEIGTSGLAFDPAEVTIAAGEIIRFTPTGPHDMTSDDGEFATTTSEVACLRFDVAGAYPYHCSVHGAGMAGTVTVE